MAITYGFFNSLNHDRLYSADQMSEMFNGIINDGVFMSIGTSLVVVEYSGMTVHVGIGRAWFNSRWLKNDALHPLTLDTSSQVLNRIDAVVVDVNSEAETRACDIKIVKGTEAVEPERPTMIHDEYHHQYPLAYIYVAANVEEIHQADITNMVGSEECPYITAILQTTDTTAMVAQWQSEWLLWKEAKIDDFEEFETEQKESFLAWWNEMEDQLDPNQYQDCLLRFAAIMPILNSEIDDIYDA